MNSQTIKTLIFSSTLMLGAAAAMAGTITDVPLFLLKSTKPQVMLTMSNDHQLFYKAYDDYSDIDGDGTADTTYKHSIDYYGYFDSYKCYNYDDTDSRFEPNNLSDSDKYCTTTTTDWSGNFLNWASMARIDTIRKILYGGYRSTDTATLTVLERTFIPNDAHSFAKYYAGPDLSKLTPTTVGVTDITLCNTTVSSSSTAYSQNVTDAPLLRVAKGDFSLWASMERWQCRWKEEKDRSNGNVPATSGLSAASSNPTKAGDKLWDLNVRVEVCNSTLLGEENCKLYPNSSSNYKPVGLLQEFGDDNEIEYGLITGSYTKNKSGGVLRKNIRNMSDEINATDGTFKAAPVEGNIIGTIDKLRIFGYYYGDGTYFNNTTLAKSDDCNYNKSSFSNGKCTNWGNPQAEIFLEALRYFAGKRPTSAFDATDSNKISGIPKATWSSPLTDLNWCAPLNIINFNASTISYDGDELGGTSDIGTTASAEDLTNAIGVSELIHGNDYFVGENGVDNNQLCTAKTVASLGDVQGTCPDAPRLDGTYHIAGLAHYARTHTIRTDLITDEQTVMTYGVALSPSTPQLTIPSPDGTKDVVLLPACRNESAGGGISGNCAIVDFKIVDAYSSNGTTATGKVYVNWEDSEQGGDYDQDLWGTISYSITNSTITITTYAAAKSTPYMMGFGYTIGGTTQNGFHAHSGINNYNYSDSYAGVIGCTNCNVADAATDETYVLGSSTANLLKQPLYYAAKWGGFKEQRGKENLILDQDSEWDANGDGTPDNYFYATNPAQLASSLSSAFASVASEQSSSTSIVADAVTLETGTHIYQAQFNSGDWSGTIKAFPLSTVGAIQTATWDAATEVDSQSYDGRVILSHDGTEGVAFRWTNLINGQKALMNTDPTDTSGLTIDSLGDERLNYIRGDTANELRNGTGSFRAREHRLGDIVSSTPYYVGEPSFTYPDHFIEATATGTNSSIYNNFKNSINALNSSAGRTPMLYAGANDGMLHGFNAETGEEKIAYVPKHLIGKLPKLTDINYGHKYYVNGPPTSGDAYEEFRGCPPSSSCWRSVLVGGLGAGGQAIYALDVTNPDDFSESDPTKHVLWEIDNTMNDFSELGYTFGQPAIVRTHDGTSDQWAAIFSNGYNSDSGKAILYVVNIATGARIAAIDTGTSSNGLSTAAPVDIDGDHIIDFVYAGDLNGNMWKFDLTNDNANLWKVAYKDSNTPKPLFKTETNQPITSRPEIGNHPTGTGYMVYFGSGKYYEQGDNDTTTTPPSLQAFYAVWDKDGSKYNMNQMDLLKQSIIHEGTENFGTYSHEIRITSQISVDWASKYGWYLELQSPNSTTTTGERIVNSPILHDGRIIFTTLIPSKHACDYGGTGWLMELSSKDGGRLDISPFDLNNDNNFTEADYVEITLTDGTKEKVPVSGKKSRVGIIQSPAIISTGNQEIKIISGSKNAEIEVITESRDTAGTGRTSWRQLK